MLYLLAAGCTFYDTAKGDDRAPTGCAAPRLVANPEPAARVAAGDARDTLPTPSLNDTEAAALAACVRPWQNAAAVRSEVPTIEDYQTWTAFSRQAFGSEHGRYVEIFGNARASDYSGFEDAAPLPAGARLLKHSFSVRRDGETVLGPLFLMEKMAAGFSPRTNDWRFILVAPDGSLVGQTGGWNADRVEFCHACHESARRQDFLMFVPAPYRRAP